MSEHLSDLQLDALRLGQAEPTLQTHLDGCPLCQSRAAELGAEAQAFLARFDLPSLAASTLIKAEAVRIPWWRRFSWPAAALATAAALFLFVRTPSEDLRRKGQAPLVELYARNDPGPVLVDGPVDPRAHLAVKLNPAGPRWVRLLWSSQPKTWQALYPPMEEAAWSVEGSAWLSREIVLDGARAPERLGAVLCARPVSHAEAVELAEGRPREDCEIVLIPVVKR